jgi:hypothetical protein
MAGVAVNTANQVQKVGALLGVAVLRWRDHRESSHQYRRVSSDLAPHIISPTKPFLRGNAARGLNGS